MESNPRTPSGAHRLRLLNEPVPITLQLRDGQPAAVRERGRWRTVERVEEVWRVEDGWWRDRAVARTYFRLLLADGHVATVYRDGASPSWWMQRY